MATSSIPEPEYGALVISLDFELHWGVRHTLRADGPYRSSLLGARIAVPRLLDLFEEFGAGVTWATVGFLFARTRQELEECAPRIRPEYTNPMLNAYREPIGSGEAEDPLHYAPSLIAEIRRRPRQELGTHTFSHFYCQESGQTEDAFRAFLEHGLKTASKGNDFARLREMYTWGAFGVQLPEFDPDLALALKAIRAQGNIKGAAVRFRDPLKGPLDQDEQRIVVRAIAAGAGTPSEMAGRQSRGRTPGVATLPAGDAVAAAEQASRIEPGRDEDNLFALYRPAPPVRRRIHEPPECPLGRHLIVGWQLEVLVLDAGVLAERFRRRRGERDADET